MGSVKAIELATVADLTKNLQAVNAKMEAAVTKLRAMQKEINAIETLYGDVSEEATVLINKAKDIGADQIVKDATAKKAEADSQYKYAESVYKILNNV